jgi:hypothetical protein
VIVAALLVALGLVMGIVVTQARGLRMSGVLVVPLFAVYSLYDFYALPLAVVSTTAAYLGLALLKRRTMLYGRVLLLSAIVIGAVVPIVGLAAFSVVTDADPMYSHLVFLGSVLPGVAAYNYHRLDRDRRIEDVVASLSAFVGLFVLGATLLNPTVAATIGRLTPTVLFASSADVAELRGAALADPALTATGVGFGASVALLLAGGVVSEAVYGRYGVRLNGLIAAPLLALFALQSPSVVPVYLVGAAVVFLLIRTINRRTLLYGRVLLSVAVLAGVVVAVPAAILLPGVSGFILLFLSILAGIGAYNFHRLAPAERPTGTLFSAALFVVSLAVTLAITRPLSGTMLAESLAATVALSLLGATVCILTGVRVARFERKRRRLTRRLTAEGVA